jgi:hypothetical protein
MPQTTNHFINTPFYVLAGIHTYHGDECSQVVERFESVEKALARYLEVAKDTYHWARLEYQGKDISELAVLCYNQGYDDGYDKAINFFVSGE